MDQNCGWEYHFIRLTIRVGHIWIMSVDRGSFLHRMLIFWWKKTSQVPELGLENYKRLLILFTQQPNLWTWQTRLQVSLLHGGEHRREFRDDNHCSCAFSYWVQFVQKHREAASFMSITDKLYHGDLLTLPSRGGGQFKCACAIAAVRSPSYSVVRWHRLNECRLAFSHFSSFYSTTTKLQVPMSSKGDNSSN